MCLIVLQEMQEAGGPGYKYLEVDEDEAANVIFCNGTMVHLAYDQIVESAKVAYYLSLMNIY